MTERKPRTWTAKTAKELIEQALTLDYFRPTAPDQVVPIPAFFAPSDNDSKLVVIVGENASGKSFMRRIVSQICREMKVECMHISMEGRGGYYGGLRGMVYGDESYDSTGFNSAGTVRGGIATCQARTSRHVIFWDEPDLGLSENGSAGVGKAIADYMIKPNEHTMAAVVVTHSKPLVRRLVTEHPHLKPHYLHLGADKPEDAPCSFDEWLDVGVEMRSLDDIHEAGHRRFKLIQRVLENRSGSVRGK